MNRVTILNFIPFLIISIILRTTYPLYQYNFINPQVDIKTNSQTLLSNNYELTNEEKLEDFIYLYSIFEDNFPYFNIKKYQYGYDWLSNKDSFEDLIRNTKTNEEFYEKIKEIICLLQNDHTSIVPYMLQTELATLYNNTSLYNTPNLSPWTQVLSNKEIYFKNIYWEKHKSLNRKRYAVPAVFQYVGGKYVLVKTNSEIPLYSILTKVNGVKVDEYVLSFMGERYLKYDVARKKPKIDQLVIYAQPTDSITLSCKLPNSEDRQYILSGEVLRGLPNNTYPGAQQNIEMKIIEKDKIAYLKVKSFKIHNITNDKEKLLSWYRDIEHYKALIIDIRGNAGGAIDYWKNNIVSPLINNTIYYNTTYAIRDGDYIQPFVKAKEKMFYLFKKKEVNLLDTDEREYMKDFGWYIEKKNMIEKTAELNFKGEVYLLVDEIVYSSAESFASFCKCFGFAKLVGSYTGGDGNGWDSVVFALPNSGLLIKFKATMGINPDGSINEKVHTRPDFLIEQSYEEFVKMKENKKLPNDLGEFDITFKKALDLISTNDSSVN